jgi:hypothetical protein
MPLHLSTQNETDTTIIRPDQMVVRDGAQVVGHSDIACTATSTSDRRARKTGVSGKVPGRRINPGHFTQNRTIQAQVMCNRVFWFAFPSGGVAIQRVIKSGFYK